MAIIHLQRRMVQVGRIRLGKKNERGLPVRLETWRLTSRDRVRLAAAAETFGGTVAEWEGRPGEYELVTDAADLPIMLLPGQTLSQWMELWSGGGCKRRCDGDTETLTDGPCLCDPEKQECKPHTRLNVMLPDVPGLGMWRLDTQGWNAARELAGTAEFLESATARGVLLPARLRIDQRVEVRDGQTKKFPVPVLDVDIKSLDALTIASGGIPIDAPPARELEQPRHTPLAELPAAEGVTVEQGLAGAASAGGAPKSTNGREAAPIPTADDIEFGEAVEVPSEAPSNTGVGLAMEPKGDLTDPQSKKLNVLVGKLRDGGHITTQQLYGALAKSRQMDADVMTEIIGGQDADGLHWAPLRDSLTKQEASDLIERLGNLEKNVEAAVA